MVRSVVPTQLRRPTTRAEAMSCSSSSSSSVHQEEEEEVGRSPLVWEDEEESWCPSSWTAAVGSVRVVAGGGESEEECSEARRSRLRYPRPCGVLGDGSVVFVQRLDNRVRLLRDGSVRTVAGGCEGFADGTCARFNYPSSGAVDGGCFFLADRDNHRVRTVEAESGRTSTIGIFDQMRPCDVAVSRRYGVFATATDSKDGAHCLVAMKRRGPVVVAGALRQRGFADGAASHARFWLLYAATAGPDDRIYLADGNRVRVYDPRSRTVETIAGKLSSGLRDGPLADALFFTVRGVAVDADLTIYVSDFGNDRVRAIDLRTKSVRTVAAGPSLDAGGRARPPSQPDVATPYSLTLDDNCGVLYAGTGEDLLIAVKVPSRLARWRARVAPVFLAFYLYDRARASIHPPSKAPDAIAHDRRAYNALRWLATARGGSSFLLFVLSFAF